MAGLSRHAHLLPKNAFADFTPDGGTPHAQSLILQQAPLSHTDQLLFQWLRDSQVSDQVRSAAAMRLVRGAGESWTQPVFEVLQNGVPEKVQVAIYGALRPWVGPQHTTWIAEALPKLKHESAAFATEMVLRHGSHGQRIHFASKLPRLKLKSIRTAAAKAAWDVDPSQALEQSFWEWTLTRDPETQILAQVSLMHALGPAKAAAGYHQRLAEERDPIVQNLLLENLQRMGTDEALEVFLLWLSLPQSLEHPMSGDWALRLIAEPTTVPLFRGWWDNRSSLTQDQKDAAAGALAPDVPSARAHLMERVPSFPAGKQIAFIDRLRENATSQEAEQWADWVRDPSTPQAVIGSLCAAISANESSAMQAALGLLEEIQETSHTQLPSIPAAKIVQAFIATGSPLLREEALRVSLQIEERLTSRAQTLTAARLRGQVINPQETDLGTLLSQARLILTVPTPMIHGEPHASRMKQAHPLWAILLDVLSAHGSWADQAMASFLEHPAQRDLLNPERLWMLVQGFGQKLPQAAARAKLHLRLGLSPASLLHPSGRARTTPIKPRYWTTPESILQHLRDQFLQAPSGDEQSLGQIAACIQRWPSDRRFWNLQGWYSLAESDWQLAEASFESSMRRSGHLPSALQEPRFGLEVMRALQGGDHWPTYLNENPDAVTNLPRFLSPLRDPRFQDLLEAQ